MKIYIAFVVLLGLFHLNKGCVSWRRRQTRRENPKIIVPTTAAQTRETTRKATTQSVDVTTTEKATTTANSVVESTLKASTKSPDVTTTEKATTGPPATTQNSEVRTTNGNVAETTGETTPQSAQRTRPTSIFGFQKSFGLKNVVNTESCSEDLNGTCRVECKTNEYLRGRFDCQGENFNMNCCVLR